MEPGKGRGRGSVRPAPRPLRKPGEMNNEVESDYVKPTSIDDSLSVLCMKLEKLNLPNSSERDLFIISEAARSLCKSSGDVSTLVDIAHKFCVKNRMNASIGARFCSSLSDFEFDEAKFKLLILRKIQQDYNDREKINTNPENLRTNVIFMCEIVQHFRLPNGNCYAMLPSAIVDYFIMLLDNKSDADSMVFVELFRKCYNDLKTNCPDDMDNILLKIREVIVCDSISVLPRTQLLCLLEEEMTNWKPLTVEVKRFYQKCAN